MESNYSNYISDLTWFNEDFSSLHVIRSPPPSRRVTLIEDMIEVVTTQDHLVKMLHYQDIYRRYNYRQYLWYNGLIPKNLCGTNKDNDVDLNQRKEFLFNVLSPNLVNAHEEMNNSINILLDNNKQVKEIEFAFDVLIRFTHSDDYANDFANLGGFYIVLPCFRSKHPFVRIRTCEFIYKLVLNNPYCQEKFMENKNCLKLKALMYMVEKDNNDEVRVKAISVVYSLLRRNLPGFWLFIEHGGKDMIFNSLKTSINKLKLKTVFLIFSTNYQFGKDVAEMYIDNGVVEILISLIMDVEKNVHSFELILPTLNQFIYLSPVRVIEICSSVEDFKETLTALRDLFINVPLFQEEILQLMESLKM